MVVKLFILFYILCSINIVLITSATEYQRPQFHGLPDGMEAPSHTKYFTNVTVLRVVGLLLLCVNVVAIQSIYAQLRYIQIHEDELIEEANNEIEQNGMVTHHTRAVREKKPAATQWGLSVMQPAPTAARSLLSEANCPKMNDKSCMTQISEMGPVPTPDPKNRVSNKSKTSVALKDTARSVEDQETQASVDAAEKEAKEKYEGTMKKNKRNTTTKEKKKSKDKKKEEEASIRLPKAAKGHHDNEIEVMEDMLINDKTEIEEF